MEAPPTPRMPNPRFATYGIPGAVVTRHGCSAFVGGHRGHQGSRAMISNALAMLNAQVDPDAPWLGTFVARQEGATDAQ